MIITWLLIGIALELILLYLNGLGEVEGCP